MADRAAARAPGLETLVDDAAVLSDENDNDAPLENVDSSEEEEDDDDEEEMERVRTGFIVDDDDDDNDNDEDEGAVKKRRRRRRSRAPDAARDEELDQDDLDLVMENTGMASVGDASRQFKRLKRADQVDNDPAQSRTLTSMFSDDEEQDEAALSGLENFIEEDEFTDEAEESEVRLSSRHAKERQRADLSARLPGVDNDQLGEIFEVFGDGEDYDWALEGEEELGDASTTYDQDKALELKDVFEPGELQARMLTDADNLIRVQDIPERYQLLRASLKLDYELSEDELAQEVTWIVDKLSASKESLYRKHGPGIRIELSAAVRRVLEYVARDNLEVPFIWYHRKDYLLYSYRMPAEPLIPTVDGEDVKPNINSGELRTDILLKKDDLWRIVHWDIEFHSLLEKRKTVEKTYRSLDTFDALYSDHLDHCHTLVDYQDLLEYLQFNYSAQIKDLVSDGSGLKRHARFGRFERIRAGKIYQLVRDFGMPADEFADNLEARSRLNFTTDPAEPPLKVAEAYVSKDDDDGDDSGDTIAYHTPEQALADATQMLAEEMSYQPKLRAAIRKAFWTESRIDIVLTDDGRKRIDESSPYADFKYAINRTFAELRLRPELYLRMLQAESEGLVEVRVSYPNYKNTFFPEILSLLQSDNVSAVADQWNAARRAVLKAVSRKIVPLVCRNIKEDLKKDCETTLWYDVRAQFAARLDQAPYKPPGYVAGTTARVLAVTAGQGDLGRDAILLIMVDEDGQMVDRAKLGDPRHQEFRPQFAEFVRNNNPDVIGIAGFSVSSSKVYEILKELVVADDLRPGSDDNEGGLLEVMWVQDEVARLKQNWDNAETADALPLGKYCMALARYLQSPLLEYASLDSAISAISIHPHQHLLPAEQYRSAVESAFVDAVNSVGVDLNEAVRSSYVAHLVPYIAGLGPRKASGLLQAVQNHESAALANRNDLVLHGMTTKTVFLNCASFLRVVYDRKGSDNDGGDPLDSTRIHPEDYELARKMAADALELDEEDIEAIEARGRGGVVAQLVRDDAAVRLNELILEEYADELERKFHQKKRETLEMIKAELQTPYGELRRPFVPLTEAEVFSMLTGESPDVVQPGSLVSANVRKLTSRFAIARLPSGIDANINGSEFGDSAGNFGSPSTAPFSVGQTIQAVVKSVDYGRFAVELSVKPSSIARAIEQARRGDRDPAKWNFGAEDAEKVSARVQQETEHRARRIIKHPLFQPFTKAQAEAYLAPLQRGDLVIRPSSKGHDHIAVTWKVSDNLYQHLDVLEVGRTGGAPGKSLMVGKASYSDLDEVIIMHVQAIARKVDELVGSEKFTQGSRAEVEKWLTSYLEANSRSSNYTFCYDFQRPGVFLLCYKTGLKNPVQTWSVRVIPDGYELQGNAYPDVVSLCNGFKKLFSNRARGAGGRRDGPRDGYRDSYRDDYRESSYRDSYNRDSSYRYSGYAGQSNVGSYGRVPSYR